MKTEEKCQGCGEKGEVLHECPLLAKIDKGGKIAAQYGKDINCSCCPLCVERCLEKT